MQITLEIPDDLAAQLLPTGQDPARAALEALALTGYRARRLSESQVKQMLGYSSRLQVHALLKENSVNLNYTMQDLDQDLRAAAEGLDRTSDSPQAA